jgi:hypothetical protein
MTTPPEPLSAELRAALERVPDKWTFFRDTETGDSITSLGEMKLLVRRGLTDVRSITGDLRIQVRRTPAGRAALKASADD